MCCNVQEYLSQAQRTLNNIEDGFYISPAFLDKLSIHVAKNFLDLPKIKVPLILGEQPRSICQSSLLLFLLFTCLPNKPLMFCMSFDAPASCCTGRYLGWQGPGQDLPVQPGLQEAGHRPHRDVRR